MELIERLKLTEKYYKQKLREYNSKPKSDKSRLKQIEGVLIHNFLKAEVFAYASISLKARVKVMNKEEKIEFIKWQLKNKEYDLNEAIVQKDTYLINELELYINLLKRELKLLQLPKHTIETLELLKEVIK